METRDRRILDKIRSEAKLVASFIDDMDHAAFINNELKKRAVTQTLANIGELVRKLSDDFKSQNKSIPWAAIRKTRNVIVHEYDDVDYEIVWHIATADIPVTIAEIDAIERSLGMELFGEAERDANYNEILKAIEEADGSENE